VAGAALLANFITPPMPVKFKTLDEDGAVYQTAVWAAQRLEIKRGDPQLTGFPKSGRGVRVVSYR
jgi:hypothetical protein